MKTALVIGLGRYGRHLVEKLVDLDIQVMAVDKKEECVQAVADIATNAVIGDSTKEDFIKSLGVDNYDLCFVAIGEDFLASLETTFFLKENGARKIIARTARDTQKKILEKNGADAVVYPEKWMGEWSAMRFAATNIFDYIPLSDDVAVVEVLVPNEWVGKSILTVDVRKKYGLTIIGVRQGNKLLPTPTPDYVFNLDEKVLVLGTSQQIKKAFDH